MTRAEPRWIVILLILLVTASSAHAQSAEAEVLFREGRRLIKAGRLEAGCDKIEASERLESSVGTLLNLGDCREKAGRYASAWAAFRKAESTAKVRGRDEKRRNEASRRALALEGKLSQLVIMVPSRLAGLVVTRDDEVIEPAMWNTPLPLDPDSYTIVAEAPGYKPWKTEVNVGTKLRRVVVTVPMLERAPAPPPEPAPAEPPVAAIVAPPAPALVARRPSQRTWTTARKVAVGAGVLGLAAAGTGVYFGLRAKELQERADEVCPGAVCDDADALRDNDRAQDAARNANILYVAGGVAVAASAVIWIVGGPDQEVRVSPTVGSDRAGVSFGGRF